MPRIHGLLDSFGRALCDKGRRAFLKDLRFGDVLPDVAKATLELAHKQLTTADLCQALGEVAAMSDADYELRLNKLMTQLMRLHSVPFEDDLRDYLTCWPATIRQVLRRPSNPSGGLPPDGMQFYKADDLLMFLPPRLPRFRIGDRPNHLDDWELTQFVGMGECSEVWMARSEQHPELSPAAMKFVTDAEAATQLAADRESLVRIFDLNEQSGIVPLRSIYLECDPPCLESAYVYGYDLTGLIHEWRWRYDVPKPEAAFKLMKRLCEIVAKTHAAGLVHRDLKPSNILFHPTEGGRFTLWISDYGWGQVAARRSTELGRGGTPKGEQHRLELRGAHTPLYAGPQVAKREAADPRDDVHALGAIWYQLLKRCPHAAPPVGTDWIEEFRPAGFTDGQAKLLMACISVRADKRPKDAGDLLEKLVASTAVQKASDDGSRLISIAPHGSEYYVGVTAARSGGVATAAAPVVQTAGKSGLARTVVNSVGMTFVLIPPGVHQMGSPEDEPGHRPHEKPIREIHITRPFYLGITPVTQHQFEKVCGFNPSRFAGKADWPVESVSWNDAISFCSRLEQFPAEEDLGRGYRLPTEAEWEYACRSGEAMPFFFGQKLTAKHAHFACSTKDRPQSPHPVGKFPPNAFGLHDMHGNVSEWVNDWYAEGAYWDSVSRDPQGPDRGLQRVTRGGCWLMFASECRSAARRPQPSAQHADTIGFRVVMQV